MVAPGTDPRSLARAALSLRCLPFRQRFYELVDGQAFSSKELLAANAWDAISFRPLSAEQAEDHFLWLIRLGVLRREVDGQGLTERVRLTPMGRQLRQAWSGEIPRAALQERILEVLRRHRPRP